jgi:hypothetical protein
MPNHGARPKIDSSVSGFDFLFEVEEDVAPDPFEKINECGRFAGAFKNMSSDVAHRHIAALDEETADIDARATAIYRKIANAEATPADGTKLEKRAKGARIERTEYPASGTCVCAQIAENGSVEKVWTEKIEVSA